MPKRKNAGTNKMRSQPSSSEEDAETKAFVTSVCAKLKEEDFAFTVVAVGTPWDVFRFVARGKKGMVAVRESNGTWEIGFFRAGEWTPEEIEKALIGGAPN